MSAPAARPVQVIVGSTNRAKLLAVESGLRHFFADLSVRGADVPSGVSEQPVGMEEIVAGARGRAERAYAHGDCDIAAGIEDGLIAVGDVSAGFMNVGCCVLFDGTTHGIGLTAGFEYPPACVATAVGPPRVPIGGVFDELYEKICKESPPDVPAPTKDGQSSFGGLCSAISTPRADPGSGAGNIGRLTLGVLPRSAYGEQAVICALVRLLQPALYAAGDGART